MIEVSKEFTFDAAHRLGRLPKEHKCYRMHGHTYRLRITVRGEINQQLGFVEGDGEPVDFDDFGTIYHQEIHSVLDHNVLNDVVGLEVPTCENLAVWIYQRLAQWLPGLHSVTVYESSTTCATYHEAPRGGR